MEVLLIDIGALALFLGYTALVYWRGVGGSSHRERARARARSARSSVTPEAHRAHTR